MHLRKLSRNHPRPRHAEHINGRGVGDRNFRLNLIRGSGSPGLTEKTRPRTRNCVGVESDDVIGNKSPIQTAKPVHLSTKFTFPCNRGNDRSLHSLVSIQ